MFRVIRRLKRADISVPFIKAEKTEEYKSAFYEKYVKTKKFVNLEHIVSKDGSTLVYILNWASEQDYVDFLTDDDHHVKSFNESLNAYITDKGFLETISFEDATYPSLYDREHVFVVFRQGAAGNFISNILDNILNDRLQTIQISTSGHAHFNSIVERKRLGADYLCLGSGLTIEGMFFNDQEKINYFKERIYLTDYENKRYVTWSHNFANIPLYKLLFPNGKVIAITDDTLKERLVGLLMGINKNYFSSDDQLPVGPNGRISPRLFKRKIVSDYFSKYYPGKKYQEGHKDLDVYIMCRSHLYLHELEQYLGSDLNMVIPHHDDNSNMSLSAIEKMSQHSMAYNNVQLSDCKIKFGDLLDKKINVLQPIIETALGRSLTEQEASYFSTSVDEYIRRQDQKILYDPMGYMEELKSKADTIVSGFSDK